jgi:RNA polymerase sigma-70 factor (ECF subfamily)
MAPEFQSYSTSDQLLVPRMSLHDLLEGARVGTPAHTGELRARFGDRLYAAIYSMAPETASELVDDVFLKLPALLASYDDLGKFEAWLTAVARNMARTAARSERNHSDRHTAVTDETPGAARTAGLTLERAEMRERLLANLDDRQRAVWVLYEEGYSHKEIAQRQGISVDNSQKILERARRSLQEAYTRLAEPS